MTEPFAWPQGTRAAAVITVNFDGESVDRRVMDLPLWGRYSHGRYGAQLGTANLLELLARYEARATFFVGAWDLERNPALIEQIASAGHEIAGHGYLHEDFSTLPVGEQARVLEQSEAAFTTVLGAKPVGFRAPERLMSRESRRVLAERGYRYDSSYSDDDFPYLVAELDPHNPLVELPVQEPWSDKTYYEKHRTPAAVQAAFVDEFQATCQEGGLFTLVLHPRGDYGSGRGVRTRAIEHVLQAIREQPNVWTATCREIADWILDPPS